MDRLQPIAEYYSKRATEFGASPLGVDWTCVATQQMRFVQLLARCDLGGMVSINDLGCGYGALRVFIGQSAPSCAVDYLGIDVSEEMVRLARAELTPYAGSDAVLGSANPRQADYAVASGIFNVCLEHDRAEWTAMIQTVLRDVAASSRRGSAVNFLASRAGAGAPRARGTTPGLYRTEPAEWTGFCRRELGADVETIAGYGLDEFTLLLR